MAPRSGWKGFLQLSLVSIPVKSFTAVNPCAGPEIGLNQLHSECHRRIKYVKTCPVHGEVGQDEIVSGYEVSKGKYVVIEPDELAALRSAGDQSIVVQNVIPADQVDPLYFGGRTQYLIPDGSIGQTSYGLIQKALAEQKLVAVALVVLNGKETTVLLRTIDRLIAMTPLNYEEEVTTPEALYDQLEQRKWSAEELKLTKTLLKAMQQDEFDVSQYKDKYIDQLSQLIEAKSQGKEIKSPARQAVPEVINLMDALKRSVKEARQLPKRGGGQSKPRAKSTTRGRKVASAARRTSSKRRKKTG